MTSKAGKPEEAARAGPRPVADGAKVDGHRNEVLLVGRLAAGAEMRELPSGDEIATFRLVVRRSDTARRPTAPGSVAEPRRAATVDTLDCVAWRGDVRRAVRGYGTGDVVEVAGALRRRFWRSSAGAASRSEVEVARVRRIRRAD